MKPVVGRVSNTIRIHITIAISASQLLLKVNKVFVIETENVEKKIMKLARLSTSMEKCSGTAFILFYLFLEFIIYTHCCTN
jgi:hypothetical protein